MLLSMPGSSSTTATTCCGIRISLAIQPIDARRSVRAAEGAHPGPYLNRYAFAKARYAKSAIALAPKDSIAVEAAA
jgi:hypothetical protein